MKKIIIAAMMVVSIGSSAFAMDVNKVSYKVKNLFAQEFLGAENVVWSVEENFTKASFTLADIKVDAFFSTEGEMIGYGRAVNFNQLPLNAIQKVKKNYGTYKIAEIIEFSHDGEKSYYVSLQNGEKKQILNVTLYGDISLFQEKGKK